jgi:hypothetical protein
VIRKAALLTSVFLLALTAPASAQLKKPRLGGVIGKVVPQATTASSRGGIRTANLTFDDRVLEITPERIERVIKGIEAGKVMAQQVEAQDLDAIDRANAAKREAYERDYQAYQEKRAALERCVEPEQEKMKGQMAGYVLTDLEKARMEAVATRIKTAKERGDLAETRRLADSVSRAMMGRTQGAVAASEAGTRALSAKCGTAPQEPTRPVYQDALTYESVDRVEVEAGGFTDAQYHILRERIAPFVVSGGESSSMAYTESEVSVLKEWLPKLQPYTEYMKRY